MNKLEAEFERMFPGLFEEICCVACCGDNTDLLIDSDVENIDRLGLDQQGTATVYLENVHVWVDFRNGISAGSQLFDYEILPPEDTPEGNKKFAEFKAMISDAFSIEIGGPHKWNDTDIEVC